MKTMAMFAILFSACVAPGDDPAPSTEPSDVSIKASVPSPINTELWNVKQTDAEKLDALWPDSAQTSEILYREGPDMVNGTDSQPAYLAFVVYNGAVQHVYWIVKGSSVGTDFKSSFNTAFSTRTNTTIPSDPYSHFGGGTGGGGEGKPPSPHPTVIPSQGFSISGIWQQNAIDAAGALDQTEKTFLEYAE
jgi:hypothetical protein